MRQRAHTPNIKKKNRRSKNGMKNPIESMGKMDSSHNKTYKWIMHT